jgi:hypothetical protein
MKKILFLVMISLLFFVGTTFSQGTLFSGRVEVEDDSKDGGSSVITLTEITRGGAVAYRVQGQLRAGAPNPYTVLHFMPDDATLERLRSGRNITFRFVGDGIPYKMEYRTSAVRDYGFHAFSFTTTANDELAFTVQNRQFTQPSWARSTALQPRTAVSLSIMPSDVSGRPPFEFIIWDVRIE